MCCYIITDAAIIREVAILREWTILLLYVVGEMERLENFWLAGACKKNENEGESSQPLGILNFTSAFILLAGRMLLGGSLLLLEHTYFNSSDLNFVNGTNVDAVVWSVWWVLHFVLIVYLCKEGISPSVASNITEICYSLRIPWQSSWCIQA